MLRSKKLSSQFEVFPLNSSHEVIPPNDIVREVGKLEEGVVTCSFYYNDRPLNYVEYTGERSYWLHDEDIELVGVLVEMDS